MNKEVALLTAMRRLRVEEHVHLDELNPQAPSPGSRAWLPILESLVDDLEDVDGRWVVKFPLGFVTKVPESLASASAVFEVLADVEELYEPPSVANLGRRAAGLRWAGENHRWQWRHGRRSLSVVSVSRSALDASAGEPFFCRQLWEIG